MSKFGCPSCSSTVAVNRLDYRKNGQSAKCPNGHKVGRVWHGPERKGWVVNNPAEPYGWSPWFSEEF